MAKKGDIVHYHSYLGLDKILSAQKLRSAELLPQPAHDETLFIIIHQVYELWFKQIIHEIRAVMDRFEADNIDERNVGLAVASLDRVIEIQKLLVQQIRVLETMTSLDFLEFRNLLFPASGFQSYQFRMIEVMLGLKERERTTYGGIHYQDSFTGEQRKQLNALEEGGSLFELVNKWLERMPFLEFHGFNFLEQFILAVRKMFSDQRQATVKDATMHHTEKDARLEMIQNNESFFWNVLDEEQYQELLDNGTMKLSYKATMAALLINLYQDEPIMQMPFNLLDRLLSIDELWTTWRYRHAQMTMGMLGKKPGTGGSSGHDYLRSTADSHHVFKDFHNITTLLIPRTARPELPKYIKKELGFYYTHKD